MSNYLSAAKHPNTEFIEPVAMLDDYFGHHNYAVLFKSGEIFREHEVELVKLDHNVQWEDFDVTSAYTKKGKIDLLRDLLKLEEYYEDELCVNSITIKHFIDKLANNE